MNIGIVQSGKILENCDADVKNKYVHYTGDSAGIS